MKVLLSWLHEFLPITPLASEVAEALQSIGIGVERVQFLGKGFEKVFVAKIMEVEKHPNADRLSLCRVTDGSKTQEIVCGASNFKVGDHVALAQVGAKLPCGVEIKRSKIRGMTSDGMLCSQSELGLSDESEGILILPQDSRLGTSVGEYLGRNDWVLELELTPNRGDCLSVIGVAREVAVALNIQAKVPSSVENGPREGIPQAVMIDTQGCLRYVLRQVESVTVKESPTWMRCRLEACGFRSINNIVDITNYVMLERGQPLHAFDKDKIVGHLDIRRARQGEKIIGLDNQERILNSDDLIIADQQGPAAIAGVMGGARTAVSFQTKTILLESAHFDPKSVRLTSRRLGLHTDSSHRFERFVDPSSTWTSSTRAIELLTELAQGGPTSGIDLGSHNFDREKIKLRKVTISRILGEDISQAGEYLGRLGLVVEKTEEGWIVEIPNRRSDLMREIDLLEEVARIHGYDRFHSSLPPMSQEPELGDSSDKLDRIRHILSGMGLSEVRTYSFASKEENEEFAVSHLGRPLRLLNPLISGQEHMRQSMIPALLATWKYNKARQAQGISIFEIGRVYGVSQEELANPVKEENRLTVLFAGNIRTKKWFEVLRCADFFDGKGLVEGLTEKLGLKGLEFTIEELPNYFHPGKSAKILCQGKLMGYIGMLHPRLERIIEVGEAVIVDLHLDPYFSSMLSVKRFVPISSFPQIQRDLAFVVKREISSEKIHLEIEKLKDPLLKKIELFDLYEGKGIPDKHRSLAYTLLFGSDDRTLTDEEVELSVKKLVEHLEKTLNAKLRS